MGSKRFQVACAWVRQVFLRAQKAYGQRIVEKGHSVQMGKTVQDSVNLSTIDASASLILSFLTRWGRRITQKIV
ncbi:hypothetical protein KSB_59380 [Ktedonobacter robiniae]|uniref:Uncharacterized protein n=1 Tax=Ktedonobacter robiniae TaxID=2778365 RepID=A0ABQ3UXH0_9CHLR|nr:hypothetical protein KSB_59380 [Ktedonobacter robiniae]